MDHFLTFYTAEMFSSMRRNSMMLQIKYIWIKTTFLSKKYRVNDHFLLNVFPIPL